MTPYDLREVIIFECIRALDPLRQDMVYRADAVRLIRDHFDAKYTDRGQFDTSESKNAEIAIFANR